MPRDEAAIFARRTGEIAREVLDPASRGSSIWGRATAKRPAIVRLPASGTVCRGGFAEHFLLARLQPLAERHPAIEVIGITADLTRSLVCRKQYGASGGWCLPGFIDRQFLTAAGGEVPVGGARTVWRRTPAAGRSLAKNAGELVAAYDDALGVTAAFNLNVLNVVNRLAGTDFRAADWRHVALFNAQASRIEMHLEARGATVVHWPGGERRFGAGERIHTENSYKLTLTALSDLLLAAGFASVRTYTDPADRFAIALAR